MAKFLVETSSNVETLTEKNDNGKQLYIEGVFAQAEVKNGNGRIYPREIMEEAVAKYNQNYVSQRRALGELNHPDRPFADPAEAAILIEKFEMQGNNVIGKAKVLDTPKGQIVKGLLEGGFNMGVSTRGLGSLVEKNGMKVVQSDFELTSTDCVDNPSAPNAYVNPINESIEWIQENGVWMPKQDEHGTNEFNEELFLERLEHFLKGIKA